jgi:hypothetical protein
MRIHRRKNYHSRREIAAKSGENYCEALRRQRIPASMKSSISPFNTAEVLPVS